MRMPLSLVASAVLASVLATLTGCGGGGGGGGGVTTPTPSDPTTTTTTTSPSDPTTTTPSDPSDPTTVTPSDPTTTTPSDPTKLVINALHHNPHWECFSDQSDDIKKRCQKNAWAQFDGFLTNHDIDFASLVMGGDYAPPGPWKVETASSNRDRAALVWNSARWQRVDSKATEFEPERAAMLVSFKAVSDPDVTLVVASLHYPHNMTSAKDKKMRQSIMSLFAGTADRVLLLADTNKALNQGSSEQLVRWLGLPMEAVMTTDGSPTCCANNRYVFAYDRIFTNFGGALETIKDPTYEKLTHKQHKTPPWAVIVTSRDRDRVVKAAYHHPVLARITLSTSMVGLV